MPIPTDAAAVSRLWVTRTSGARQEYIDGVNAVRDSPMDKAAGRSDAYVQGVQRAVQSGKWQAGLRRVSLANWKQITTSVGADRLASGVTAARPKFEAFMREFLPFLAQTMQAVDGQHPRGDLEANIRRATATMRAIAEFRRQGQQGAAPGG